MAAATKTRRKPAVAAAPATEKKAAAPAKPAAPKPARKASEKTSVKAKAEPQPKPAAPAAKTTPKRTAKAKAKTPAIPPYRSDGLIRGPLVSDTLQALQGWELEASKRANLEQLRQTNSIGAPTQAWLKKVCSALSSRFEPAGRDRALVLAARTETGQHHWKSLLLWHLANSEQLLGDGLRWSAQVHRDGADLLQTAQVLTWLESTGAQGHPEVAEWSEATRKRVAGGLLKAGVDLGLLQGRIKRRFTAYYLADEPLLYVLLQALASNRTTAAALADPRWLWFRLPEAELEHRLLLLHQAKVISYYRAGSVVDLKLPASSAEALVQEVWS
ncbi:BrxA family protein [Cyanobium sp. A2C-AMD]|uniref:BrxA family protein n=1 Tax=Cyanobium sp. A2C-AMD TaxID=2823695 RepID=UPI0020CEE2B5|nr:BrxA family protein [Cyanobium sp. A2C-AMD]MCP9877892.1 DUF1819 family protein [Cyanobium sp. A2C-AMD]